MIPAVSETYNIIEYTETTLPSLTYALDLEHKRILGKVDELEAIKQAVYLILSTERYEYLIYSWNYGVELTTLIGTHPDIVEAELETNIAEALTQDDRINGISDFETTINKNIIHASFTVNSIFGDTDIETEVEI